MEENIQPEIVETPTEQPVVDEVVFPEHGAVLPSGEVIVHDTDENGNVIGWHKEVVNG